ncbi:MAG: PEP-utilizing enzyme [Promicromonosporaceae bacterium]|nr:PEP-utilizing enzyme [Promicromonosporaceae bacterium]
MSVLRGVPVSAGKAVGPVIAMPAPLPEPPLKRLKKDADLADAAASVEAAARKVAADLDARAELAAGTAADLLSVTAAMASDPTLAEDAARRVLEDRETPARAVWDAAQEIIDQLKALGGAMAERRRDVRDVRNRIVAALLGQRPPGVPQPGHPYVLVAGDLAPSDAAILDPTTCLAIVTESGGPTSHTAIMARALGIPAVVAVKGLDGLSDGETVLVDGKRGTIKIAPTPEEIAAVIARQRPESREFSGRGVTADGVHIELFANVTDRASAKLAAAANAEGVGLMRTESVFFGRSEEPTLAEQVAVYRPVFKRFAGRKVVIRTLDVGSNTPLPYLIAEDDLPEHPRSVVSGPPPQAETLDLNDDEVGATEPQPRTYEPNPAMGVRGLRTATQHPKVLNRQLKAIAAAAAGTDADVWVMAPMVSTPDEAAAFAQRCAKYGLNRAGAVVEVPAAALTSRWLAEPLHFLSIGTNDLTAYAMAADRGLGALAELTTVWQPAVLTLISSACAGAREAGRPIGVCGEAAADPALAPVLVGLGASSLSMAPKALGDVAAVLASVSLERCRELARMALGARDVETAQRLVREGLPILVALEGPADSDD